MPDEIIGDNPYLQREQKTIERLSKDYLIQTK